jgi:hypothetical protein
MDKKEFHSFIKDGPIQSPYLELNDPMLSKGDKKAANTLDIVVTSPCL